MITKFNKQEIEKLLPMYRQPDAIYLKEVKIKPPRLTASLIFPETPIYLNKDFGIKHINNTEVEMIINQGMFLFYRQMLLEGELGFPKIEEEKLQRYYDDMFLKQEIDYYERFTPRNRKDLILNLEHSNTRKIGSTQLVWCNLLIPKFMHAEVIGGLQFNN